MNSQLITGDIRAITWRLKEAIGNRDVKYGSIEAAYLTEEIYNAL